MEQETILMECGHSANAIYNNKPRCVICDCDTKAKTIPNLEGRKARCNECGIIIDSSINLPFFKYKPECEFDDYYCGCEGWD